MCIDLHTSELFAVEVGFGVECDRDDIFVSPVSDIFFVLVNIAKFNKIDAEEALRATNNKFIKRFQHIEAEVSKRGKTLKETPLEELEQYWQDAKSYKPHN